jgi:Domain of unknown function (DUF5655)
MTPTADRSQPVERPLWACPRCGKRFVTPNMAHSCQSRTIDEQFAGRPRARELFEAYRAAIESLGPADLVLNKTAIAFMTRVRFAGCRPRRDHLRTTLWLKRRVESARFAQVDFYGHDDWVYTIDLRNESEIDAELMTLLREARAVGDQKHLRGRVREVSRQATSADRP